MINFLKDILNKLNDALDVDKTDAEQSFDLLYIIQERLGLLADRVNRSHWTFEKAITTPKRLRNKHKIQQLFKEEK